MYWCAQLDSNQRPSRPENDAQFLEKVSAAAGLLAISRVESLLAHPRWSRDVRSRRGSVSDLPHRLRRFGCTRHVRMRKTDPAQQVGEPRI